MVEVGQPPGRSLETSSKSQREEVVESGTQEEKVPVVHSNTSDMSRLSVERLPIHPRHKVRFGTTGPVRGLNLTKDELPHRKRLSLVPRYARSPSGQGGEDRE